MESETGRTPTSSAGHGLAEHGDVGVVAAEEPLVDRLTRPQTVAATAPAAAALASALSEVDDLRPGQFEQVRCSDADGLLVRPGLENDALALGEAGIDEHAVAAAPERRIAPSLSPRSRLGVPFAGQDALPASPRAR